MATFPTKLATMALVIVLASLCTAQVRVAVDHNDNNHTTRQFKFDTVPPPSRDDAATDAQFTIVYGEKDANANDVARLHDGNVPNWEDQPEANFAFATGDGGRLLVDLGRAIDIAQVNTYSWHPGARGPQVYKLYISDGMARDFDAKPEKGTDPTTRDWTLLARIDTRPKEGDRGGQYGVSISDNSGSVGHDRYLLFDVSRTESDDDWGNTFYSEIDVIERGAKPAPVAAYWSQPAPHDPPGDPMDWNPPAQPPPIRSRHSDGVYAKLAKAVRDTIDVDALRAPGRPVTGLLVREVTPGGQATKLGISVGDILMSLDGVPIGQRGESPDMNEMRSGQPQQLVFWSPHGGERTVTIQPGRIGVDTYDGPRLAESYARSTERDPKWDHEMLVATSSYLNDPFLAETALARAVQAGYQGRLFDGLAARIAYGQCRFVDALDFGWPNWSANQRLTTDTLKLYYKSAMLGFKPEQALDLAGRYPGKLQREEIVAETVKTYRAMPKSALANPIAELDNVRRTRIHKFGVFVPLDGEGGDASEWGAASLNRPEVLNLDIPSAHYSKMILTPGFANVALSAHYDLHNTDQIESPFAHSIAFGLYDMTTAKTQWENPKNWLKLVLMTDGPTTISPFGIPEIQLESPRPAVTRIEGTIRMVILHNRCEVTLDEGRRIYYGPVVADESKRRYGFFMIGVGVNGQVNPPVFERLEDPRPPAAIPESQPAPK
jgi:hypothetical protein